MNYKAFHYLCTIITVVVLFVVNLIITKKSTLFIVCFLLLKIHLFSCIFIKRKTSVFFFLVGLRLIISLNKNAPIAVGAFFITQFLPIITHTYILSSEILIGVFILIIRFPVCQQLLCVLLWSYFDIL